MQLRKRDKNKKIFEVFVTKEKTIIWNIDFSEEIEITKPPETIFESLELHQNKLEDKIKHKYSVSQSKNSRSIRKIAKKLIKVKKYKLGEVANQVLTNKNYLKAWFKHKIEENEEFISLESNMKEWILNEMQNVSYEELQQITLKYFNSKEEDPIQPLIPESPNPILKNLANSYFPKNNQNNIRNPQPKTNINGIWICNKPPGKKLKKENNDYWVEVIPIDLGLELDDWNYQEVILWDLNRKELKEITIFVNSMVKDILIDSGKFVDEEDFNKMVYKTIKDIVFQREEYEFLMNNKECFIEFQLTSNLLNNDNIITIEININEEGFEYNDAFEWDVMNNMKIVDQFCTNLCQDMKFPEKVWIEVNIQMKQQIIDFFRNRFSKLKFTYQCLNLTGQMDEDTGIEEIKEGTIENMEKSKKLTNRNYTEKDYKDLKPFLAHSLTEKLPILPSKYEPYDETYYLHKHELYQYIEKNLNLLNLNRRKIFETHASFHKSFISMMQQSQNRVQTTKIQSENQNRLINYNKSVSYEKPQILTSLPKSLQEQNMFPKPTYTPNQPPHYLIRNPPPTFNNNNYGIIYGNNIKSNAPPQYDSYLGNFNINISNIRNNTIGNRINRGGYNFYDNNWRNREYYNNDWSENKKNEDEHNNDNINGQIQMQMAEEFKIKKIANVQPPKQIEDFLASSNSLPINGNNFND